MRPSSCRAHVTLFDTAADTAGASAQAQRQSWSRGHWLAGLCDDGRAPWAQWPAQPAVQQSPSILSERTQRHDYDVCLQAVTLTFLAGTAETWMYLDEVVHVEEVVGVHACIQKRLLRQWANPPVCHLPALVGLRTHKRSVAFYFRLTFSGLEQAGLLQDEWQGGHRQ